MSATSSLTTTPLTLPTELPYICLFNGVYRFFTTPSFLTHFSTHAFFFLSHFISFSFILSSLLTLSAGAAIYTNSISEKRGDSPTNILDMTQKRGFSNPGALGIVEYLYIDIAPRSTPTRLYLWVIRIEQVLEANSHKTAVIRPLPTH